MKWWLMMLLLSSFGSVCDAQTAKEEKRTNSVGKEKQPQPAASFITGKQYVYFPDYYAFYDPNRGYVFWNEQTKNWNTSLEPPQFMHKVDMSKVRIQILKGLSLDLHPERNYPNYMRLYPAQTTNPDVPVPNGRQAVYKRY